MCETCQLDKPIYDLLWLKKDPGPNTVFQDFCLPRMKANRDRKITLLLWTIHGGCFMVQVASLFCVSRSGWPMLMGFSDQFQMRFTP